jgi:hypothetical protein
MFFPNGVFSPEAVTDPRVRAALVAASAAAGELVEPIDLLAGLVRHGSRRLAEVFGAAARPDWHEGLPPARTEAAGPRAETSFSETARAVLEEFTRVTADSSGVWDSVGPEVLAYITLGRLSEPEAQRLGGLDVHQAQAVLLGHLLKGADFGRLVALALSPLGTFEVSAAPPDKTGDSAVPSELEPADDLSRAVANANPEAESAYAGDPDYDRMFDALARALCRRQPRHVFLTGERGVGRSTVLAELARRAALRSPLAGRRFFLVDCRDTPPDETRRRLTDILNRSGDEHDWVIALDGLPHLLIPGQPGNKDVLTAGLRKARCRVVAILTPRECDDLTADDPDFADLFSRVDVPEPCVEAAVRLVRRFADGMEHRFGVVVDDEIVRQAVVLSAHYILNDQLPAKAVRILHRVCEDLAFDRDHGSSVRSEILPDDVVRAVAELTGVPEETLRGVGGQGDYSDGLREAVLGQPHAVREVATELGLIKAGMTDPGKPASVMLFLGQTGTGKTELAKAVARLYSTTRRLKTYTLGNCVEPHSVATIIGVPPGYVGHDQGGRLVNDLLADPYCVFLLDEADKAHPDVLQPFLNLFDEGWVADQRGVKAHADKAIFVLTTNVGQRMIAEMAAQGKSVEEITIRMKEALGQIRHTKSERPVFTPEFLARVKRVVIFTPLDRDAMAGIARKQLVELARAWETRRNKQLVVPDTLAEHIAAEAHRLNDQAKGREGGRVVRKLIADWVEAPLQRAIAARPDEYRGCQVVVLEFDSVDATLTTECVQVRFDFDAEAPPHEPCVTSSVGE